MAYVMLDTTVVIDALRGRPVAQRVRALRAQGDQPYVCAITVEETVRGLRPAEEQHARRFFAGVRTVPLGEREGWRAGEWRRAFSQRGRTVSQPDCLIAAAAVAVGARLATGTPQDFPMEELTVEHWPVGE
jgi:hypothetical protein